MSIETREVRGGFALPEKLVSSVRKYIEEHYADYEIDDKQASRRMKSQIKPFVKEMDANDIYSNKDKPVMPSPREKQSLEKLVDHMDESFSQTLLGLIDQRGLRDSDVYKRANIDRRLFSKIRSDFSYRPSKNTALSLAIALKLNIDQTKDLLLRAGFALSNSSKADVIIQYFIENKNFNIYEINEVLDYFGEKTL